MAKGGGSANSPIKLLIGLDIEGSVKGITSDLESVLSRISKDKTRKIKIGFDQKYLDNQISSIKKKIGSLNKELGSSKSGGGSSGSFKMSESFIYDRTEQIHSRITAAMKSASSISSKAIDPGDVKDLNNITNKMIDLNSEMIELRKNMSSIDMSDSANVKEFSKELDNISIKLNQYKGEMKEIGGVSSKSFATASSQAETLLRSYEKAIAGFTASKNGRSSENYKSLINDYNNLQVAYKNYVDSNGRDVSSFSKIMAKSSASLKDNIGVIRLHGEATKSFGDKIKDMASKFSSWLSVSQIIMHGYRTMQQAVKNVIELDTAMTELKKVTDETSSSYDRFLDRAGGRAKSIGATLSDTITATADFARLGYSIQEAEKISDAALIYKNVGDGITDISVASESIISTMKAFGVGAEGAIGIVDRFNEVGNNFAISSAGVGEALTRSSSAMAAANNTLDETIALATAANTVVQDPQKVGTTMKTVSMFLRAAKTEAAEAGVETEGMANSVSKLREEFLSLTGGKVDIQIDDNTFKSTYQILKDISLVWNDLTDVSRANLLERMGGKRNANVVAAIIENFDTAEAALATSLNSVGSASKENEKVLESINGKVAVFKATFQELSKNLISSSSVKTVVDFGTRILELVNRVTLLADKLGGLKTILGVVFSVGALRNADALMSSFRSKEEGFSNLVKVLRGAGRFNAFGRESYSDAEARANGVSGNMTQLFEDPDKKIRIFANGFSKAMRNVDSSAGKVSKTLAGLKGGFGSLFSSMSGAQKGALGISAVLAAAAIAWNVYNNKIEDSIKEQEAIIDKNKESIASYRELDSAFRSYESLNAKDTLTPNEDIKMGEAIDVINNKLGDRIGILESTTSRTQEYTDALREQMNVEREIYEKEVRQSNAAQKNILTTEASRFAPGKGGIYGKMAFTNTYKGAMFGRPETEEIGRANDIIHKNMRRYQTTISRQEIGDAYTYAPDNPNDVKSLVRYIRDLQKSQTELIEQELDATPISISLAAKLEEQMALLEPILTSEIQMLMDASLDSIGDTQNLEPDELISRISGFRSKLISDFARQYELDTESSIQWVDKVLAGDDFFQKYIVQVKEYEAKSDALESVKSRIEHISKSKMNDMSASEYEDFIDSLSKMSKTALEDLEKSINSGEIRSYEQIKDRARQAALQAAEDFFDSRVWQTNIENIDAMTQAVRRAQADNTMVIADKSYLSSEAYENIVKLAGGEQNLTGIIDKQNGNLIENADALRELIESSERATFANIQAAKSHEYLNYHNLTNQLYDVVNGMNSYDEAAINTANSILSQIDLVDTQIAQLSLLEQQLLGASSAYDQIVKSQEIDEARDQTPKLASLFDNLVNAYKNKEFGTEVFKTAFEGLIPDDIYSQFEDAGSQIEAGYNYINDKLSRYISTDDKGDNANISFDNIKNFVNDALSTSLGEGLGNIFQGTSLEDFSLNNQIKSLKDFADSMGVTEEVAFALGNAISKYTTSGNDFLSQLTIESLDGEILATDKKMVDLLEKQKKLFEAETFDSSSYMQLQDEIDAVGVKRDELAEKAREEIKANIKIDADIKDAQEEIEKFRNALAESTTEEEYNINHQGLSEAKIKLAELLQQKHSLSQPTELVLTMAVENVRERIKEIKDELAGWTTEEGGTYTLKADIDIPEDKKEQLNSLISELRTLEDEQIQLQTYLNLDENNVKKDITSIDEFKIKDKNFRVTANTSRAYSDLRNIINTLNLIPGNKVSTVTLRTNHITSYTTTRSGGTNRAVHSAFAIGTNGVTKKRMENTLVGELGRELVVNTNTGKYFVAGENGAEMITLPKGSIVYNHKETERILKNKAKEGFAFANGTGFSFLDKDFTFGSSSSSSSSKSVSKPKSTASNKISSVGASKELAKAKKKVKETAEEIESEFERLYRLNNHLIAMNAMSVADYLNWLDKAYKEAYDKKEIELEDYYKYEEEVYKKLQDLFKDYLSDVEHEISILSNYDLQSDKIISYYRELMDDVIEEYNAALASGLDHTDDYVQELREKFEDYRTSINDIREKAESDAKSALNKMIDYRISMLKKENDKEKDVLNEKLKDLKDFYNKQKELLKKQRDEDDYLENQGEKRKNVADIRNELNSLRLDDSAWAQKKKVELQADLAKAMKELQDLEDDRAYEMAIDALDQNFDEQSRHLENQIDRLAEKIDNPAALYNQALADIRNNTGELYDAMVEWNRNYGSGNDEDIKDMYDEFYKAMGEFKNIHGTDYKGINPPNTTNVVPDLPKQNTPAVSPPAPKKDSNPKTTTPAKPAAPSLTKGSVVQVKSGTRWYADSYGGGASGTARGGKILYINTSGSHAYNIDGLGWVRKQDIVGYYTGTNRAKPGIHRINELGEEAIFSGSDGSKYRLFSGGEKVFSAKATDFLYRFANAGGNLFEGLVNAVSGNLNSISPAGNVYNIDTGDIVVQGGLSDERTVSEIRRAQRDNVSYMLKQLGKLGRNNA